MFVCICHFNPVSAQISAQSVSKPLYANSGFLQPGPGPGPAPDSTPAPSQSLVQQGQVQSSSQLNYMISGTIGYKWYSKIMQLVKLRVIKQTVNTINCIPILSLIYFCFRCRISSPQTSLCRSVSAPNSNLTLFIIPSYVFIEVRFGCFCVIFRSMRLSSRL